LLSILVAEMTRGAVRHHCASAELQQLIRKEMTPTKIVTQIAA
jgi:hypothetical protein